ncbi:YbfB/YjiJ family MFS transporter [Amycolatopsis sp. K13G38]|uniref:YbfB/YjiJ family MFS transporter n=1 Tax=Amycolatopsis acididurans TaxID=2724524 RepID=A0ABX1J8R0_9PSEU|nr:YbfB/YjiJ family MFS transporter [Amycolatopsis acididurans]NKQ56158.1 YbfB/YjiJ family MFS transporter [Amycolatopsis acididurans]
MRWGRNAPRLPSWAPPFALVVLAAAVSQVFGRLTFAVLLPQMTADYLGDYQSAGIASATNLAAYVSGTALLMACGGRYTGIRVLRLGLAVTLGGLVAVAVVSSFPALCVAQAFLGLGGAGIWLACAPIAADHAPEGRTGVAMGAMFAGIGFGIAANGGIVWCVEHLLGPGQWRVVWWIAAAVTSLTLALATRVPRRAAARPHRGAGRPGPRSPARRLVRVLWLACLAYLAYGIAYGTYATFLTAALHERWGLDVATSANLYSLMGPLNLVGALLLGRASDSRVGRLPTIVAGFVAMAIASAAVATGPPVVAMVSPVVFGLVMSGIAAAVTAYVLETLPPMDTGTAYASVTLAAASGQVIAPLAGGRLADSAAGFTATYGMGSGAALCGAIAMLLFVRRMRARTVTGEGLADERHQA